MRAPFEAQLGHDFAHVRIHSDGALASAADAVNARALTFGNHIIFGPGNYQPETGAGRSLLGHELVHVAQQRGSDTGGQALRFGSLNAPAEAEASAFARMATQTVPQGPLRVRHRLGAQQAAFAPKATEFPGFSQGDFVTCGAASLISALMIWDRERKDPNSPNTLLVAACNSLLVYMDDNKTMLTKGWDAISIKGATGQGSTIYDGTFASIKTVRDAADLPKAQITAGQYQDLGLALYVLTKNSSSAGMTRYQMMRLQSLLGVGGGAEASATTFDEIMDKLTGLRPGQIAQVSWYYRGKTQANNTAYFTAHAFLVGRFQRGAWFVSDQGSKPPTELEAPDLLSLRTLIRVNTATRDEGIHTGGLPAQNIGGMQIMQINPNTGAMILGDRGGVETKARDVIMKPGDFIAEVDASIWRSGDKIYAWDFVARKTSLAEAQTELNNAGTGSGGVIVENPVGLFHVFKTNLVSDKNVSETSIDESDSTEGKLSIKPRRFYHAWLQLRSATKTGSFFQVY